MGRWIAKAQQRQRRKERAQEEEDAWRRALDLTISKQGQATEATDQPGHEDGWW